MSTFHPRRLLLATAVASLALPVVAEEHGFLEDASANLNLRNFFYQPQFHQPHQGPGGRAGVDPEFHPRRQVRLHPRHGRVRRGCAGAVLVEARWRARHRGTQLLPLDHDGRPADDFGRLAVAVKGEFPRPKSKSASGCRCCRSCAQTMAVPCRRRSRRPDHLQRNRGPDPVRRSVSREQPARRRQHERPVHVGQDGVHLRPLQL